MAGRFADSVLPVRLRRHPLQRSAAGLAAVTILVAGCTYGSHHPDDPPPPDPAWRPSPTTSVTTTPSVSPLEPDATPSASAPSATPENWTFEDLLVSAQWVTRDGGASLAVDPTALVRHGRLDVRDAAWAAIVAEFPDADTVGMQMQFNCHHLGAPDKEHWFLEPWRPEVTYPEMIASRCNPV